MGWGIVSARAYGESSGLSTTWGRDDPAAGSDNFMRSSGGVGLRFCELSGGRNGWKGGKGISTDNVLFYPSAFNY